MRLRRSWSLPALAGGLFLLIAQSSRVAAQNAGATAADSAVTGVVLDGRAVDAQGKAVAGLQVSLHRVDSSGGARVASAVTDSAGRFHFEMAEPAPGGVLFAAARYEGELYVGPPLRGRIPQGGDYTLVVGSPATSANAMMGGTTGATAGWTGGAIAGAEAAAAARRRADRFWTGLIGVVVVGLAAVLGLRSSRAPGVPEGRRVLMELAAVEERIEALRPAASGRDEDRVRRYEEMSRRLRRRALGDSAQEIYEADAAG